MILNPAQGASGFSGESKDHGLGLRIAEATSSASETPVPWDMPWDVSRRLEPRYLHLILWPHTKDGQHCPRTGSPSRVTNPEPIRRRINSKAREWVRGAGASKVEVGQELDGIHEAESAVVIEVRCVRAG